jgi:hypothetical protein
MVWGFCYLRIFKKMHSISGRSLLGNAGNNGENKCKPDHNRSKLLAHWIVKDK